MTTTSLLMKVKYLVLYAFFLLSCRHPVHTVEHVYHYQTPDYSQIKLVVLSDTLRFNLGENMYNDIESFNCFTQDSVSYISFYDRRSESINVYQLYNQHLCKKVSLKNIFKNRQLYKTTVFIKNWDSIFVTNKSTINLFDSSGHLKQSITFPNSQVKLRAEFDSDKLPVLIENKLYGIIHHNVDHKSIKALRSWKVLYEFDLKKRKLNLLYHLPTMYQKQLYGYYFLDYNFCYTNHGKFVISFPADTMLYETDLDKYNHSYFARSQFQKESIQPVENKKLLENKKGRKEYITQNSYGPVFFDPFRRYYLRLARHKVSAEEFQDKKQNKQTVLVFNEELKIIGESDWPGIVDFDSFFFTPSGQLYARTDSKNEYALNFVRLDYKENKVRPEALTKK